MNSIVVNSVTFEFSAEQIAELRELGAIYFCDEHDAWHLMPDHDFSLGEVEILMSPGG